MFRAREKEDTKQVKEIFAVNNSDDQKNIKRNKFLPDNYKKNKLNEIKNDMEPVIYKKLLSTEMIEGKIGCGLPQKPIGIIENNTFIEDDKKNILMDQHPENCSIIDENIILCKNVEKAVQTFNETKKTKIFATSQNKLSNTLDLEHNEKVKNSLCFSNTDTTLKEPNLSNLSYTNLNSAEFNENNPIKSIKKVNKKYQELLENSILNFDKPRKEKMYFSYIYVPNIEKKKKNKKTKSKASKSNTKNTKNIKKEKIEIPKKEVELPIIQNEQIQVINPKEHKQKKIKGKNGKIKVEENLNNDLFPSGNNNILFPNLENKFFLLDTNLNKIYSHVRDVRFLGRKRNNIIPDSDQVDSEIILFNSIENNFKEVKFKNPLVSKILVINQNSENIIKKNFYDEGFLKTLKNSISVLQEKDQKNFTNKLNNTQYFNSIFLPKIPNPFDENLRRCFAQTLDFINSFKDEYAPIQMQKENENLFQASACELNLSDNIDKGNNLLLDGISIKSRNFSTASNTNKSSSIFNSSSEVSKTHFIKKKQSALNIKRQCGVSYVVTSESKQLNVENSYKRLGHLVYQGTNSINQISEENFEILNYLDYLVTQELMNSPLIITMFESPDEEEMKEYLLNPEKRLNIAKEIFIIESLDDLWKFSKDRLFVCIHLLYDPLKGVRNFTNEEIKRIRPEKFLILSNIQIGFLFRKSTCGIKSVLKLYKSGGLDKNHHPATFKICNLNAEEDIDSTIEKLSGSNMSTLSIRMELYVPELAWKKSSLFNKEFLYTFICLVEEKIIKLILNWNDYRYLMHSLTKDDKISEYIQNLQFFIFNMDKKFESEENFQISTPNFNLQKNSLEDYIKSKNFEKSTSQNLLIGNRLEELKDLLIIKNKNPSTGKSPIINNITFPYPPLPMYIISTRDCFVFDLNILESKILFENRIVIKKEFFFDADNVPTNFHKFKTSKDDLRVGVVTYENFYSHEELLEIEKLIEKTEEFSMQDAFLPETAQKTFSGEKIKRTKFFFGSRYMWTKKQLSEPNSYVAAGIRKDVSPAPYWMKEKIENPLVEAGIVLKDFVNSFALNVYHDGSEGLGQHFDDAVRFKQPIYTVRLFSDCRLSFGSQLYGFCNGAFTIPLPRGCICVMEENSYASNGVKHCIRPVDMSGKSSALIMRQMHPLMVSEAEKYDYLVDFPSWFSSLSIDENSIPYVQQKIVEAENIMKLKEMDKKGNWYSSKIKDNKLNEEVTDTMQDIISTLEIHLVENRNFDEKNHDNTIISNKNKKESKKKGRKSQKDY